MMMEDGTITDDPEMSRNDESVNDDGTQETRRGPRNWRYVGSQGAWMVAVLALSGVMIRHSAANLTSSKGPYTPNFVNMVRGGPSPVEKLEEDVLDDDNVLHIHVVPHTHDDPGWLKTVDQYFHGWNDTIQKASVNEILDTVVIALLENPSRTFTYVEQKFFSMWWNIQTDDVKETVRYLVKRGQLSFVNGGWCMQDEAATHFMGMIDQTTTGHSFLKRELNVVPRVGWQIDPFGHSKTQASLFTGAVGFDSFFFGRIDYQDLDLRHEQQECEGLWSVPSAASASDSPSDDPAVFWGLTGSYRGNYGAPAGFCFDELCNDELLLDLDQTQMIQKVETFLSEIKVQSDRTKGNHIMLTMGEDFNYRKASQYFANNDHLIASIMNYQRWGFIDVPAMFGPRFDSVNIFYSTPDRYTKSKFEETLRSSVGSSASATQKERTVVEKPQDESFWSAVKWSIKTDDFFPYSDCPHCFWTGYFTSRASLKRLERVGSTFLLAARQIIAMDSLTPNTDRLFALEDAVGLVQHHDAVSGTSKQHVADDYSMRVQAGINEASEAVTDSLKRLLDIDADFLDDLEYCQLLNETICSVSQKVTMNGEAGEGNDLYVVVYNALSSPQYSVVRLPVSVDASFAVSRVKETKGGSGNDEPLLTRSMPCPFADELTFVVAFDTGELPPVGAAVYRVTQVNDGDFLGSSDARKKTSGFVLDAQENEGSSYEVKSDSKKGIKSFSTSMMDADFDMSTGALKSITSKVPGTDKTMTLDFSQIWGYYTSFDSDLDKDAPPRDNSGAYLFRPSTPDQELIVIPPAEGKARFLEHAFGFEVVMEFEEPWIKQVTRFTQDRPYVEVEYQIGPIPIDDGRGKEIVTRFSTPTIENEGVIFTDSNGREFMKRTRDYRPSWPLEVFEPVAGNYYPCNAAAYIEDEDASLAVLVDRSQGAASILDGSIELMVQRRILADDHRGVGEPLNETTCGVTPYPPYGDAHRVGEGVVIRGRHRIMVGDGTSGASLARSEMDASFTDAQVFVGSAPSEKEAESLRRSSFSALQEALPENVMLVTFTKIDEDDDLFLLRLGHQYDREEHEDLSRSVEIDLSTVFSTFRVASVVEKTLSANQDFDSWTRTRYDWTGAGAPSGALSEASDTIITLQPLDIRTFHVKLVPAEEPIGNDALRGGFSLGNSVV